MAMIEDVVDVLIIGGGVTGLTAAYTLHTEQPHLRIALLEAGELGGKLRTDQIDGMVIERGPDSFLARKPAGVALCEQLGIADQLIGRNPDHKQTFVKFQSELHPLPEGLSGLVPTNLDALHKTKLLDQTAVTRFAQEVDIDPDINIEESVDQFMTRRFGRVAYERLMEPLMGGIYGGRADLLSLDAVFPNLRRLERKHGSVLRGLDGSNRSDEKRPPPSPYPPFVSFPNGIQTLIDALVGAIPNDVIYTGTAVRHICKNTKHHVHTGVYDIETERGRFSAKNIIFATPAYVTANIVRDCAPGLADALAQIEYASSALVTLAWRGVARPTGYGYVIPRIEQSDVLACTFSSNKWIGRAPDDVVLVRVFLGRYGMEINEFDDEQLIGMARDEVGGSVGLMAAPFFTLCHRWKHGMPQYMIGHEARRNNITEALATHDGLFIAGQLDGGVGIPDCIRSAKKVVSDVVISG